MLWLGYPFLKTTYSHFLISLVFQHQWTSNINPLFKLNIQPYRSLVYFCVSVHFQKPMFFSSLSPFKCHFPKSFLVMNWPQQWHFNQIFSNTLENERENDMEINHILLLDQNHSLSLSCSALSQLLITHSYWPLFQ